MPPNILLITVDDMNGDTPGAFGGHPDVTPALDRLAAAGTIFRRAHVAVAVCQPSRSAMLTGRWPHRNGAEGFGPIRDGVTVLTDLLRPAGYLCGILGKVSHLAPVDRFGWDLAVDQPDLGMGRDPAIYGREAAAFLARARDEDRPWFLMANAHDPHRPFHGSTAEERMFTSEQRAGIPPPSRVFEAGDSKVPGFLPALPEVEAEVAEYLSSCRRADDVVGATVRALREAGAVEDTLIVALSDNGMSFPFAKANCYLHSTRTPLVVSWPGRLAAGGSVDAEFVSALDLFPTFCDAAGIGRPDGLDGESLLPLLAGETSRGRDHVHTVFHETKLGVRYEMRCVQDATYGYIWNAWSDGTTRYFAENLLSSTWTAMTAAVDPAVSARADFYLHRRPEELYCFRDDPDAVFDLAGDAEHDGVLAEMRDRVSAWMVRTSDPLTGRFDQEILRTSEL